MMISRLISVVFLLVLNFQMFGDITLNNYNRSQQENSIRILDISPGRLLGMSREREEYYVVDSISSKLENRILLQIHQLKDGALKETVHLKYGDCASPSELCDPTFVQYHDNKFFIYDVNKKISVFDSRFTWLFSSRYYRSRHFVDFFGKEPNYKFVLGASVIKGDKIDLSVLLNSFGDNHLVENEITIETYSSEYKRKRYTKNGTQFVDFPYFIPMVSGFQQNGKIIYSINTKNIYTIYDPLDGSKKVVPVPKLKGKLFSENDAKLAGYFKTDGFEERKKKSGLVIRYSPHHEKVYHLGMHNVGENQLGFISDLNCESMLMQIDIFNCQTGKYIKQVNLPVGKNFTSAISIYGPGFRHTFFDFDRGVYIWQDVNNEFETITCLGVLEKD